MAANPHHRPDPSTADRLVAGRIGADDAPPGYRRVARLFGEAGSGFPEPAADAEAATVSAMVAAIQAEPTPQLAPRRSTMLRKVVAAKTVAIVSVLALSATGAAAGTGNLPDGVQDRVANAAKAVGLNIPHGVERVSGAPCVVNGTEIPARNRGQFLKKVREDHPEALAAAKESRCGMPVNSDDTPGDNESSETPGNNGKAGEHGKAGQEHGKAGDDQGAPTDTPAPVEAPNEGGIGTGSTASDDANATGAGAAADGSDNAGEHPTVEDHPSVEDTPAATLPIPNS